MTRRVLWITLFAALVVVGARMVEHSETAKVEIVRVAGVGLLAASLARARQLRARFTQPLDMAMASWLGVELLATLFSRAPRLSVFGEQEQHEGLLTSLALFGVYVATRLSSRANGAGGPEPHAAHDARRMLDAWLAGA